MESTAKRERIVHISRVVRVISRLNQALDIGGLEISEPQ
jgi:hypothetical protein